MSEAQNKGAVFVSHATEDKDIAERVIKTLARGLSLPNNCFFYTSKLSIGVPSGQEFLPRDHSLRGLERRARSKQVQTCGISAVRAKSSLQDARTAPFWTRPLFLTFESEPSEYSGPISVKSWK